MDNDKRTQYDNENIYSDEYFKVKFLGIKVDLRNVFW